ncbi:BolA/IbaG family iron-sulfur metabolism protein [Neoehrlichia mikurensis]|uniref:BolA/IbaG family iron-sulfur metabolism protein n=1 Tax=Neoehrlichia mikurensis TaxID=89586 RepID=A0A9Q9BT38_9RICK|nr:BolA/IbaG family iron-sulfur metabolism protein [Neoehrlichia mikurensis]QXK91712.1 BolA/IbaG family iron-sulfur metabolism protein [Neoehrlichia mikurensis]QXK92924.1 BolA/IbaG family iron-sulfur metabolism protein [Neoehrlichia mikurensis]QXK93403.1 BolA/IbaG family iron-sulfur metabolism protein [Neoehrlichia mikurensis]UTO55647.1 BolA/IbaG family iron-sulfur metabolism protein [Neoehrlichia mikurensis]UTO56568.1 BolA/IbaG family iron-sulfur metabolism protein [Neoehrlichia mikurensis]
MAITRLELETLIKNAFPNAQVSVSSLANDNDHYSITVLSEDFKNKSKIAQHRMIYEVLNGIDVHAVQIHTGWK